MFGVGAAGIALARGQVDAGEFAARSSESTLQAGLAWARGVIGQTALPVEEFDNWMTDPLTSLSLNPNG